MNFTWGIAFGVVWAACIVVALLYANEVHKGRWSGVIPEMDPNHKDKA